MFQSLRKQGHLSSSYIDDCYLQGDTYDECRQNVIQTKTQLQNLRFFPHEEKSQFTPMQQLTYLGFELNSVNMTVRLTGDRATRTKLSCT